MSKTVVCFGDSNTYGYDPYTDGRYARDERWPGILSRLLGDGYEVIEEGCNGRTTIYEDVYEPWKQGRRYLLPCLNSHKPVDILIIMLGSNDLKKEYNASAKDIAAGMSSLLADAVSFAANKQDAPLKILLLAPPLVGENILTSPFAPGFDETARKRSMQLAPLYKELANKYGCEFLNAAEYAKASDRDSLHLMPEGHKAIAEAIRRNNIFSEPQ